ncbi:MAG: hypothetical protein WED05_11595 [Candidatus Atabeyarchaeum deiterrae]
MDGKHKTGRKLKGNRNFILLTAVLMISFMIGPSMFVNFAAASSTTYTGSGNNRSILERANNLWSSSVNGNNTLFNATLPGSSWTGYQLGTTFTNIARNADYVANGQFTGPGPSSPSPWSYSESGDTSYLDGAFATSPPTGTTTGSDYITLTGKTVVVTPITNMNFTSSGSPWVAKTVPSSTSYGTYTNAWNSNEWNQKGAYNRLASGNPATVYADMYCDQNFTVSGATFPLILATLTYKTWVDIYQVATSATLRIRVIFSYFPTPSTSTDTTILDWTPLGTNSKPTSNSLYDLTSRIASNGNYRVRLWTYVSMTINTVGASSTLSSRFDDVGIYMRNTKFSSPSQATWGQTFNFGQYATTDGRLTFKYYTDLTTLAPPTDSYLSAWVGSNRYDIAAFSSIATGGWRTATTIIPYSVFNGSATISIKVGVYIGSNLQIQTATNPRFYFDNVTFFIKYKPTPASIKLGIYDDANHQRWNDTETTYGSGTLTIKPYAPRSAPWGGEFATFYFVTNGTNGKLGYNLTTLTYSYTSTMYVNRQTETDVSTFTVHDDTRTSWYCNYSTPTDIGGYQNYNVTVYVPTDWIWSGLVTQIRFAATVVTNYATASNASIAWINIPATVFAPNPPKYPLEIWTYSPNYSGPSSLRTLIFTQCNTTNLPTLAPWVNETSFIPKNVTRLVGYIMDLNGGVPLDVNSSSASIRLYNESGGFYTSFSRSVNPYSNGTFFVQLDPWSDSNVTWHDVGGEHATYWRFTVNWTNGYECANGMARFTTDNATSHFTPTTLTSPNQPYTATYLRGFTLVALYWNARNGSGIQGATLTWNWNASGTPQPLVETVRGNYIATINGSEAYNNHFAPEGTWIQVNATLSGYVARSIMVRVFVRDEATTGSSSSFVVPYQTYGWNTTIPASLLFQDADNSSSGIPGAKLYVNGTWGNATVLGSSGIGWWYKDSGNGNYQITFLANASSTGLSAWAFTIKVNKTYYAAATFGLNGFNIRDRFTAHSEPSLSVTTPWADNATFLVTFRDTDAGGAPIFDASATSNWTINTGCPYAVATLGNGTYRFSLSVTGLAPQTISFSFSFSKPHWTSITFSAWVIVRNITTTLNSAPAVIAVSWGDNATATVIYRDVDHNSNISSVNWDLVRVYDEHTGTDYTGNLTYNIYWNSTANHWVIRINGSLPLGSYTLWMHALPQSGYYDPQLIFTTLNVNEITTSYTVRGFPTPPFAIVVYWSDLGQVIINYTDVIHGAGGTPISGATINVVGNTSIPIQWFDNSTGVYTVFFNSTGSTYNEPFHAYGFTVFIEKLHYGTATIQVTLVVASISARIEVAPPAPVAKGHSAEYTVRFLDTTHTPERPIVNATITLDGVDPSHYTVTEVGDGYYRITLNTDWISEGQSVPFLINASRSHYSTATAPVTFRFESGITTLMVIMVGGASSGAVIVAVLGFILYRRSKIPFVIKKIDQSIKLINKGVQAKLIPELRTRDDTPLALLMTELGLVGMAPKEEKPTKGKAEPVAAVTEAEEVEAAQPEVTAEEPVKPVEEELEEEERDESVEELMAQLRQVETTELHPAEESKAEQKEPVKEEKPSREGEANDDSEGGN